MCHLIAYRVPADGPELPATTEDLTEAIAAGDIDEAQARRALYLIVAKEHLGPEATDTEVLKLVEELGGLLAEVPVLDVLLRRQ